MVKMHTYRGLRFRRCCRRMFAAGISDRASCIHYPHQVHRYNGGGYFRKVSSVLEMIYAWVLTFPGCSLIGYLMAKLLWQYFNQKVLVIE